MKPEPQVQWRGEYQLLREDKNEIDKGQKPREELARKVNLTERSWTTLERVRRTFPSRMIFPGEFH